MQPGYKARETFTHNKPLKNKESKKKFGKILLMRKMYKFDIYNNIEYPVGTYNYNVDLIVIKDFIGANSVINTNDFIDYSKKERDRFLYREIDYSSNIIDLYPLESHLSNKNESDVMLFNKLNDFILSYSNRINRRVTKKAIVYKKDKCKNIISIRISSIKHIIVYVSDDIYECDCNLNIIDIKSQSYIPFKKVIYINNISELSSLIMSLTKYLNKSLNINQEKYYFNS